jgi:NADPH-dependent 2,4-dienoyl-CoA reductase/sulfur reductase-like enzyme
LREAKIRDEVPVTFITAEPFLGHFGIGGMGKGQQMVEWFFKKLKIDWITSAAIKDVTASEVNLVDNRKIPFKFAIIIPPFKGVQAVRNSAGMRDERGFVTTNSRYQHTIYSNVYAAGVAVAVKPPAGFQKQVTCQRLWLRLPFFVFFTFSILEIPPRINRSLINWLEFSNRSFRVIFLNIKSSIFPKESSI